MILYGIKGWIVLNVIDTNNYTKEELEQLLFKLNLDGVVITKSLNKEEIVNITK